MRILDIFKRKPENHQEEIGNLVKKEITTKLENTNLQIKTNPRTQGTYTIDIYKSNKVILAISVNLRNK
jgi:hypothetical protein